MGRDQPRFSVERDAPGVFGASLQHHIGRDDDPGHRGQAGRRSPEYGLSVVSYRLPLLNPEFPTTVLQPSSTTPSPKRRTRVRSTITRLPNQEITKSAGLSSSSAACEYPAGTKCALRARRYEPS